MASRSRWSPGTCGPSRRRSASRGPGAKTAWSSACRTTTSPVPARGWGQATTTISTAVGSLSPMSIPTSDTGGRNSRSPCSTTTTAGAGRSSWLGPSFRWTRAAHGPYEWTPGRAIRGSTCSIASLRSSRPGPVRSRSRAASRAGSSTASPRAGRMAIATRIANCCSSAARRVRMGIARWDIPGSASSGWRTTTRSRATSTGCRPPRTSTWGDVSPHSSATRTRRSEATASAG